MEVKLTARHGQLTEDQQSNIRQKAEKLLHFFDRITMIEVCVDLQNHEKHVEVLVDAEHRHDFTATGHGHDLMAAVDEALAKMQAQIHKYKEKIQSRRPDPGNGTRPQGA